LPPAGEHAALPLDGFFGLHPSMPVFARSIRKIVRASFMPWRRAIASGRISMAGRVGERLSRTGPHRIRLAQSRDLCLAWAGNLASAWSWRRRHAPLVIRGRHRCLAGRRKFCRASDDLAMRVLDLYQHRDSALAAALRIGLETGEMACAAASPATWRRRAAEWISRTECGRRHAVRRGCSPLTTDPCRGACIRWLGHARQ